MTETSKHVRFPLFLLLGGAASLQLLKKTFNSLPRFCRTNTHYTSQEEEEKAPLQRSGERKHHL